MGSLSNLYISQSYQSLIHLSTDTSATTSPTQLQDGVGTNLGIYVNTNGEVSASSFSGSINGIGNVTAFSSSVNNRINSITGSGGGVSVATFNAYTASTNSEISAIESFTASVSTSVGLLQTFSGSQYKSDSSSFDSRLDAEEFKSTTFATTGSNTFVGIQTITSSLRLNPTTDPNSAGDILTSSFLFQSASNTALGNDLYFRQNGNLTKWKWIEGQLATGILYGGIVNWSGSTVYISSGSGVIIDYNAVTGSEINPIIDYVQWNDITASITNITSSQVTYLLIDSNGALQQQNSLFTPQQFSESIPLGAVGHFDFANINAFGSYVNTAYGQGDQTNDFIDAFGPLKINGYGLTPIGATLGLSVGSGTSFIHGGFYKEDPNLPSIFDSTAATTASIVRCYTSGSTTVFDTNGGNFYTTIDPTQWDDSGTLDGVGASNWSIQRVYSYPQTNTLYVYYGQETYGTFLNALQGLATDSFTEGKETLLFTTFIGYLVVKGNTTNLSDTNNNRILTGGLFRNSGVGGGNGGAIITSLDDLDDVTITSATNGEALIYNAGVWVNGNPTSASFAQNANLLDGKDSTEFATTGSNTFIGTETISGSIQMNLGSTIRFYQQSSSVDGLRTSQVRFYTEPSASDNNRWLNIQSVPGSGSNIVAIADFPSNNHFTFYNLDTHTISNEATIVNNGNQINHNGALQVSNYNEVNLQAIGPTVFQGVGTSSVAYEQFINAGNYDAIHIQSNLNAGTDFQDLPSDTFVLNTWLNIPTNTGNNPAPQFKRGLGVTGSVIISSSAAVELQVIGGVEITGSVAGNITAVTVASSTASIDFSKGSFFTLTIPSSSVTYITGSNLKPGQTANIILTQQSTTGSVRFESTLFKFPSGSINTGSAVASAVDMVSVAAINATTLYSVTARQLI
jgi:hypothetical protein